MNPFIVTVVAALVIMMIIKKTRLNRKNRMSLPSLPPGPRPWPIIGNIPEMLINRPTFRWIHSVLNEMDTEIACIRFGKVHVIAVTSDEIAREVLKEKDAVFASRTESFAAKTITHGYKTSIFTPYGDQWKKMRRILVSDLNSPAVLHWLNARRDEEADNLLAYVYNTYKNSNSVDVRGVTRHYSASVTRRLMFNKRYFGEAMPDEGPGAMELEHVEAVFSGLEYIYAFCISDYLPWLEGSLDLDGREKLVKKASDTIDKFHEPIINKRIQQWRISGEKTEEEVEDWLDILITLKDTDGNPLLTPEEIKAQTKEIMLAAVDNPSNNVEWALAEMLNQPEILEKAIKELDMVVGKNRLVQESDIPNLNYVKACSREAFRLHPILPFLVPHVALADTTLAGYFIPKGSHVHISRIYLGRNPKVWEDPLRFKPERHFANNSTQVVLTESDMRFVTFSTGRRGCVAAKLGTSMTIMLLARLLQGFTWSLPSDATCLNLTEAVHNLFLATPLVAQVEPRLAAHLYPKVQPHSCS